MQEVGRVLRGRLLIENVMVVERETTYGGLAHCGVYNRLDLSLREFSATVSSAFPTPSVSIALLPDATFTPSNAESQDNYHE